MAETTTDNPHTHSGRNPLILAALILLLIAVLGFMYHQNQHQKTTNNLPNGWAEYKNDKYGFKFEYLQRWGAPQVSMVNFSEGVKYSVLLLDNSKHPSQNIKISIDTNNLEQKICESETKCTTFPPVTSSFVKNALDNKNLSFLNKGSDYYSTLHFTPANTSILNYYKIVNLKKVNGSAIVITYAKLNSTGCKDNQIGINNKCINSSEFDQIKRLADSIKSI